jgi:small conductance mechanosensitive channel
MTDITTWARSSGLEIVLFISGAIVLSRAIKWLGSAITGRIDAKSADGAGLVRSESAKHSHVVTQVTMWAAIVLLYCTAAVLTLQRLGIPITGLVAPAAVVAVALGFGAQRLVQDVLAGLFIIIERQYGFGDVVRIAALGSEVGVSGTVEEVTLRVTRLRTISGEVVIVANGQVVQVTNMSRDWARAVVDVPVPNTADVNRVREILQQVGLDACEDEKLGPLLLDSPSVVGVERLDVDMLHVRIVARTLPGKQFEIGRELRARVAAAFQAAGINVATSLDTAEPVGAN